MNDKPTPITFDRATLYYGDSRDVLPLLEPEQFTACVCDPPYHLTQASRKGSPRNNDPGTPFGRTRLGSKGFMGKTWDGGDVAFRPEFWPKVRVLKPGGMLLAFGGTRTFHRLTCAIEDARFEIRDCLMWLDQLRADTRTARWRRQRTLACQPPSRRRVGSDAGQAER